MLRMPQVKPPHTLPLLLDLILSFMLFKSQVQIYKPKMAKGTPLFTLPVLAGMQTL